MKRYEFQNYITHRSASIITDEERYPGYWFVLYYDKGELDCELTGTTYPGTGERRFTHEETAIKSAIRYVKRCIN